GGAGMSQTIFQPPTYSRTSAAQGTRNKLPRRNRPDFRKAMNTLSRCMPYCSKDWSGRHVNPAREQGYGAIRRNVSLPGSARNAPLNRDQGIPESHSRGQARAHQFKITGNIQNSVFRFPFPENRAFVSALMD